MFDTVLQNGEIITPYWRGKVHIGIKNGKIAALAEDCSSWEAKEFYDAGHKQIIPALVDTHVHLRDPGYLDKEDFFSGTCAAAAGGYGTVVAQPNTNPPATDGETINILRSRACRESVVDFAIAAMVIPANIESIPALKAAGAILLEAATCDVPENWLVTAGAEFLRIFAAAKELDMPVAVYATEASIIEQATGALKAAGRRDALAWAESRPVLAEAVEAERIAMLACNSGAKVMLRQISTAAALAAIDKHKQFGNISVEVNPHHLFLEESDLQRLGAIAKMIPPLRSSENVQGLWQGLQQGRADMLGGDHAPHTWEEKTSHPQSIWEGASGVPSLETALPLMLDKVHRQEITMEQAVLWMAERPSRWLGLYPRKGTIAIGSDADLTLVDLNAGHTLAGDLQLGKCKWTPFEGRQLRGRVEGTMVRGNWVFKDKQIVVSPGYGREVLPG